MIALALAAAAMSMPGGASGGDLAVEIPGRSFEPARLQALVGQTVTFHNSDAAQHTATADGGEFSSPLLGHGDSWSHTFHAQGVYRYHCTLHREMRGVIEVSALGLTGPVAPVTVGGTATLTALAPQGTESVTLERLGAAGAPAAEVARAVPDAAGHVGFTVTASEPLRLRARAGSLTSRVVALQVAPKVTSSATRHGRRIVVRASVAPALPGARVALQRYVRERFDFRTIATARLGASGRATFTFRTRRSERLRVAVVRPVAGWSPGASRSMHVRSLRR